MGNENVAALSKSLPRARTPKSFNPHIPRSARLVPIAKDIINFRKRPRGLGVGTDLNGFSLRTFMMPEDTILASQGARQPTVQPRYNIHETRQQPACHSYPTDTLVAYLS